MINNSRLAIPHLGIKPPRYISAPAILSNLNNNKVLFLGTPLLYKDENLTITGHYIIISDTSVTTETGLAISPGQYIYRIIFDGDVTIDLNCKSGWYYLLSIHCTIGETHSL